MPRQRTDEPGLPVPPSGLPYHTHPIFRLRRLLIIVNGIGAFLCFCSYGPWEGGVFGADLFFLCLSIFLVLCDLTAYALKKAQHPDEDPKWPTITFIFIDISFAVVLLFMFFCTVTAIETSDTYYGFRIWRAWAALAPLFASFIHAYCFWKQLMARYKKKWLASLPIEPCARCGYTVESNTSTSTSHQDTQATQPNIFAYAGPSASFQQESSHNTLTPQTTDSAMEEGLLIGSEFVCVPNYGAVGSPEPTIADPEEILVEGKSKGKKKKVGGGQGKADKSRSQSASA